jgi:hypothetical protein
VQDATQQFYLGFRSQHSKHITKHFLKLSQKLSPLRVACSGGKYPIQSGEDDPAATDDGEEVEEAIKPKKSRKKKEVKYSDFVFTGKFKVLLSELERIRDSDPACKSTIGSSMNLYIENEGSLSYFLFYSYSEEPSFLSVHLNTEVASGRIA